MFIKTILILLNIVCVAIFSPVNDLNSDEKKLLRFLLSDCRLKDSSSQEPNTTTTTESPKDCELITCPLSYFPICGSDGRTYGNECELEVQQCYNKDIIKLYDGECKSTTPTPTTPILTTYNQKMCEEWTCHEIYEPNCGSDGKTYSNNCYLVKESYCKDPTLVKLYDGICRPTTPYSTTESLFDCDNPTCEEIYDPICGSDGRTYDNECWLAVQNYCGIPIDLLYRGECIHS